MRDIYQFISKAASVLKVFVSILAPFYIFIWVLMFGNVPYIEGAVGILQPFADVVKSIIHIKVDFFGAPVDITYLLCAGILCLFYPFCALVEKVARNMYSTLEAIEIKRKERDERLVNKSLELEYRKSILEYSRFVVLFELNLNTIVDPHLMARPVDVAKLKEENYINIKQLTRSKYSAECQIVDDRIYFIFDDFNKFDKFLPDFLGDVKKISAKNQALEIETSFYMTVDAMRLKDNKKDTLANMVRISSFNYKNKAIATAVFADRYNFERKGDFKVSTMGISRFFSKDEFDKDGRPVQVDFELFSLKKRPRTELDDVTVQER